MMKIKQYRREIAMLAGDSVLLGIAPAGALVLRKVGSRGASALPARG